MDVKIINGNCTEPVFQKHCQDLRSAVKFFAIELLDPDIVDIFHYQIDFVFDDKSFHGACYWEEWDKFVFQLNKASTLLGQIQTLAHEMIHMKQYVTGQLMMSSDGKGMIWEDGSVWPSSVLQRMQFEGTYNVDTPWEQEAFGREAKLTLAFYQSIVIEPDPLEI